MDLLWSIKLLDGLMVLVPLIFVFYLIKRWLRQDPPPAESPQVDSGGTKHFERFALVAGLIGGFFAVYVAYVTLRNQAMLTAKTAINADAGRLLDWERSSPHIRCLYNWYSSYDRGDDCLAAIATNADRYSEASLYIEEVYFILKQARDDERRWSSKYIKSIGYWRVGVEEDPTGLFRNFLAGEAPTLKAAVRDAGTADLKFASLCDGYHRVQACFRAVGEEVRRSEACHRVPPSAATARTLPRLIATCQEQARVIAVRAAQIQTPTR